MPLQAITQLKNDFAGEIRIDAATRKLYATDASVYQEVPLAIATPKNDADIHRLIAFANEHQVGLIPRTAGTSLAGQVVGSGIVVDVSRHLTQIIEINADQQWVWVQPGVIRNELNLALKPYGLLFGPETSTANRAMIGGMLGNNSCGANSIVYGSTRDHVLEVTGFLSDGSQVVFGPLSDDQFKAKCSPAKNQNTLESSIYQNIQSILDDPDCRKEIERHFPKPEIERRNTGYAIDRLINTSPLNLCQLIAGSEGTLFLATEIKLRCLPLPPPVTRLLCPHFETVDQALRATQIAMKHHPYACELIDRFVLEGAARNIEQRENLAFIQGKPGAILLIEMRGATDAEAIDNANRLLTQLDDAQLAYHLPMLDGDQEAKAWELRKAGLGVVANVIGDKKPVAVIEDTAVAIDDLPEFIAEFQNILHQQFGTSCVFYGHAGAGEIHLRPHLNLKTEAGVRQFRAIADATASLVKKYRGSLSGEHGDGRLRAEYLQQMIGEKNYQLLRKIKQAWDPHSLFNPNKIIDAPPMDTCLRYRPTPQPIETLETVYDFSEQQGIVRAAEQCNGVGACRKTELSGGTMCPSYMATRNESDTTRARANLLRHVLTDPSATARPFGDTDLKQIMDTCLGCKGCKRECPSNVDVAKLKGEFLQGYYDVHGVPAKVKRIASFSKNMQRASRFPALFNGIIANRWTGRLFKRFAGIAPERSIPPLSPIPLRRWFQKHSPHPQAGKRGKIFLFCDEFTNYLDTPIGIAAIELAERIGYTVEIPDHDASGRAALSKGLLRQARAMAESNVKSLAPLVTEQTPLVGIEPSAILGFRDEYPSLVSPELRSASQRLAPNCLMFDEWIDRLIQAGELDAGPFITTSATIRLHGHCHQKALASLAPTVRMLQLPRGYTVRLIPSGCCGMAGSFGYEPEHYDLSMKVGELVLFPTIRSEPEDVLIAAPGTSCRHQIADGTGRRALHPVEILRSAWAGE